MIRAGIFGVIFAGSMTQLAAALPQDDIEQMHAITAAIGQTRFVRPKKPLQLCDLPSRIWSPQSKPTCFRYDKGSFLVEAFDNQPNRLGRREFRLRLPDGRVAFEDYLAVLYETDDQQQQKRLAGDAACDKAGGVRVGMTRAQVYASCWGKPRRINVTITARGRHEQFVYSLRDNLYLDNGVLTSIQTASGR